MTQFLNKHKKLQCEKYFFKWYNRFTRIKLMNFNLLNHNIIDLLNQFSNVVSTNLYLSVLYTLLQSNNTNACILLIILLVDISKFCLKIAGNEPLRSASKKNSLDIDLEEIKHKCYVILYRLLPSALIKFLNLRIQSRFAQLKGKFLKEKIYLYTLLINVSKLSIVKVPSKNSRNDVPSIYHIYKSMPKGNSRNALKNAIAHIYRLRNGNFKVSTANIFKDISKRVGIDTGRNSNQNYTNDDFKPSCNRLEQNNELNIGKLIIKCIEFIANGLKIDIETGNTKKIDKLLLKCYGKLKFCYYYNNNEVLQQSDNKFFHFNETVEQMHRIKFPEYIAKNAFGDIYLQLMETITDRHDDNYINRQMIEIDEKDMDILILKHGEIRRLIWGPALIRFMNSMESTEACIKDNKIPQIKRFKNKELERVLSINDLLERMSLALGYGKACWLAAAQNHTDSYLLKS